jgi:hypothetical protein
VAISNLVLPQTQDVPSEAVRSVWRRGFYDATPMITSNQEIMGQVLRLGEEVAEFGDALRELHGAMAAHTELADVAIVLAQIAWLTGMPSTDLQFDTHGRGTPYGMMSLNHEYGELCRALRKYAGDYNPVHLRLVTFANMVGRMAASMQFDLEGMIMEKLTADEKRGRLHAGAPT